MQGYIALMIPILALTIPDIAIWTKHQQRMAEMGINQSLASDNGALAAQNDKIRALEDRVKVLERIVTDHNSGANLASQIEALRDESAVPLALNKERV